MTDNRQARPEQRRGRATVAARRALGSAVLLVGSLFFTGMLPAGGTAAASTVGVAQSFGAKNTSGSATLSASPGAATTAGDLLVAAIRSRNTTALAPVSTVIDTNAADHWVRAASVTQGSPATADAEIWYVASAASLATSQSVTVTVGGTSAASSALAFTVLDVTGAAASSPLDVIATKSGSSQSASTGTTTTTTQASEIAIGGIGWNTNGVTPSGQTAGYTTTAVEQSTISGSAAAEQAAWKFLTAMGAQSYGAALSSSTPWTGAIATFKVGTPPPPVITKFLPTSGPVGTSVTITGTGFSGATAVGFNGINQPTFTVNTDTQITATVPAGATSGQITVTTLGGTANTSAVTPSSFTVSPSPTPAITKFLPTSGPVGTSVTITGTGFTGATAVGFHGINQPTFTVNADTQITATVPAGATTGQITVTTPGGTANTSTLTPSSFTVNSAPTEPHVMVIVEENQGISNIIGSSSAPYINNLANTYASAANWYSVQGNSPNDYLELLSGSNQGYPISTRSSSAPTLVDELHAKGIPWNAYMENLPSACSTSTGSPPYSPIHNPFRYFANYNSTPSTDWCSTANQNTEGVLVYPGSSGFVTALSGANAPDFVWITPNDCNDMHGASGCPSNLILAGDNWLSNNIAPVISSPWFAQNGIIIITWDEGGGGTCCGGVATGGHIATIVVTSNNKGLGKFNGTGDHYGTLAAIEKAYGVNLLLASSNPINGDLTGAFGSPTTPGTISGTVTDSITALPIGGATVCISTSGTCGSTTTTTAGNGTYTLSNVAPGSYQVTASATAYVTQSATNVVVATGATTTQNFALVPNPGSIGGKVTDMVSSAPIAGATVCISTAGTCSGTSTSTAADGTYTLSNVTEGSYSIMAAATNYTSQTVTVNVAPGALTTQNYALVPKPGSISGTVTDSVSHAGLFPATVSYTGPGGSSGNTNTTDVNGDYTLSLLAEGSYQVTASAIGYSSLSATVNVAPGTPTTYGFALTAGPGTISGTVTDSITALPIGGATVCISTSGTCGSTTTTTAGNGTYTLSNVAPGSYQVTASATAYVTQSATNVVVATGATTTQNFALVPNPGSIGGKVTDMVSSAPIAGATVCTGTDATCSPGSNTTTTAVNGTYTMSGLTEGSYQVNVVATNYVSQSVNSVSVTPGATTTKNFALVPNPGSITGTVKDSVSSTPISGATVCISTGGTCSGTSTTTAADGTYTLSLLAEGSYQVTASAIGYSSLSATVNVAPGTPTTYGFALTAGPGTISGTVTDSITGLPIGGATVCISTSGTCGSTSTTTAGNGTYTLSNVAPGSYQVTASATAYVTQSTTTNVVVSTGSTTTQGFQLVPNPGSIGGTVTDMVSSAPIAGATVCISTAGTCSGTSTSTAADGTYTLSNVTEGSYSIMAAATNYTSQTVTVNVAPGALTTQNYALVPKPGSISGTVTDSVSHAGLFPATVSYTGPGGSSGNTNTTDVNGDYTLSLLAEGSYQVTAAATNYTSQTVTVTVAPNASTTQSFALVAASHQPIFSDGFESGNFSAWTKTSALTVETTHVHTGTFGAEGNVNNAAGYAQKTLPSTYTSGYQRIWFNVVAQTSQINVLRVRTAAGSPLLWVLVDSSTHDLDLSVLGVKVATSTTAVIPGSGWHELEVYAAVNGASPSVEVWFDGTQVTSLTWSGSLGSTPIGGIQIGESSGQTWDVAFDDVAFDTQFLP